jgi:hypothetical protein
MKIPQNRPAVLAATMRLSGGTRVKWTMLYKGQTLYAALMIGHRSWNGI